MRIRRTSETENNREHIMNPLGLILLSLTATALAQAPSLPTPEQANLQFEVALHPACQA